MDGLAMHALASLGQQMLISGREHGDRSNAVN